MSSSAEHAPPPQPAPRVPAAEQVRQQPRSSPRNGRQPGRRRCPGLVLDRGLPPRQAERHGHRPRLRDLWKEPKDDHAVAVSCHGDTPHKVSDLGQAGQPTLNLKLSAR